MSLAAVNPGHWTEDMRTDALSVAELSDASLKVAQVTFVVVQYKALYQEHMIR